MHAKIVAMKEVIESIPKHLRDYVVEQEYDEYTPIDHACWRYIMKLSKDYFKDNAHEKYLDGLEETGITTERIPRISEMNEKLKKFGWRAAPITGFIPPAIFSEMLALNIMPIACDMRKLENIDYTPSPDIVHEAAGHAPIVADESYASYLRKLGQASRRVIFAKEDCDVYEAILDLSEIKEDPGATDDQIQASQHRLDETYKKVNYVSEATELARIGWWTIEYGLIKKNDKFLIYGAGLLSSIGESYNCLNEKVEKVPFTIDCIKQDYDITKPQPQLFYSESFEDMEKVIDQFAATMAWKMGGEAALNKAKKAETVTTTELNSGIQISGIVADFRKLDSEEIFYLHYSGPSQLSYKDKQIDGQGAKYHLHGFGTPLGNIKGIGKDPSALNNEELKSLGIHSGGKANFEFESGVVVSGDCIEVINKDGKNIIFRFENCWVKKDDLVLFDPEWGTFDMACGSSDIPSVFGGAADRSAYIEETRTEAPNVRKQKKNHSEETLAIMPLYAELRKERESGSLDESILKDIYQKLQTDFPSDWLLRMELLELTQEKNILNELKQPLMDQLTSLREKSHGISQLIDRGFNILNLH